MKFIPYRLSHEYYARILRDLGWKANKKSPTFLQDCMREFYSRSPQSLYTLEFTIQAEEYGWMKTGKTVYFPADLELANSFLRMESKVQTAQAFYNGPEIFIIQPPKGIQFDGRQAAGMLVTIWPHTDRGNDFLIEFGKKCGLTVNIESGRYSYDYSISCVYQEDPRPMQMFYRFMLHSDMLPALLQSSSADEWMQLIEENNDFDYLGGRRLDERDKHYQYDMMRFILNFLLFKKAMPERIRPGLPGIGRKEAETPYTSNRNNQVIEAPAKPEIRGGMMPHYRMPFMRQLTNERYYRGEYEHLPRGSRVVAVSDTFVLRDIDARTAE